MKKELLLEYYDQWLLNAFLYYHTDTTMHQSSMDDGTWDAFAREYAELAKKPRAGASLVELRKYPQYEGGSLFFLPKEEYKRVLSKYNLLHLFK